MSAPEVVINTKEDLDALLSHLIALGIVDDQNFSVVRGLPNQKWEVSFKNAEHVSIAIGEADYTDIHRELMEKRSYNAKLIDGGLLQLQYLFEVDRPIKHRLAFLPSPSLRPFQNDPEDYLRDALYVEIVSRRIVPFPLRFDFDMNAAQDATHPACHLTLGDVKGCRIPVSAPLTPRWFIEFVLRNFYNADTYDLTTALPCHRHYFAQTITTRERELIHVMVP
ncbi:DUF2290 domain-containing protein [Deferrisoma palaeochoriense]